MSRTAKVVAVIPAYEEAGTIGGIVRRAIPHVEEVYVVDDGSSDETSDRAAEEGATVIRMAENGGKAASLITGFRRAIADGAEGIVTLDGDGQHCPEDIPRLVDQWRLDRNLIVIAARTLNLEAFPSARLKANRFANFWISWAAGFPVTDSQSGFRLYPAPLLAPLSPTLSRRKGFVFESEILIDAGRRGSRVRTVPIEAIYAEGARPSHFRPVYDITQITLMVAGKLLSRGMCLPGLFRALTEAPE
jgi:glycosyltransferase involved in cell wall biosynthesis